MPTHARGPKNDPNAGERKKIAIRDLALSKGLIFDHSNKTRAGLRRILGQTVYSDLEKEYAMAPSSLPPAQPGAGQRQPRVFQQSAIERANTAEELLAAIESRLQVSMVKTKSSRKPSQVQPTFYLTLTGHDSFGNDALKTGFTGYENSGRPEAAKTYNPRATQVLAERKNICAVRPKVWEEVLRNYMRPALPAHELDHEVFYGTPNERSSVIAAFDFAVERTEALYRKHIQES